MSRVRGTQEPDSWRTALRYLLSPFLSDEEKLEGLMGVVLPDSPRVREFLSHQGVLPLVNHEFARLGLPAAPCIQPDGIQREFMANVLAGKRRERILTRVLAAASAAGIPVLVMRTPCLVETLYAGNYGLRSFRDVDLAIVPGQIQDFLGCLKEVGLDVRALDGEGEHICTKAALGARLELIVEGVCFDLHWELSLHYNFCRSARVSQGQSAIWARAVEFTAAWGSHYVMCPQDQLCHLIEHATLQHDMRGMLYRNLLEIGRMCVGLMENNQLESAWVLSRERRSSIAFSATLNALDGVFETNAHLAQVGQGILSAPLAAVEEAENRVREMWSGASLVSDSKAVCSPQASMEASVKTMSAFVEGAGQRRAFVAALLLPSRRLAQYSLDASLTRWQYVALLLRHYVTIYRMLPILPILAKNEFWECRRGRSKSTQRVQPVDSRGMALSVESNLSQLRLSPLTQHEIKAIQKSLSGGSTMLISTSGRRREGR